MKIQDYEFGREANKEQIDFKDDVRDLLNNGKYQFAVGTAAPTHNANPGEGFMVLAGGSAQFYLCWTANTWVRMVMAAT